MSRLAARKISVSTFSGSKHDLFSFTIYPAMPKALSEGTYVAGMQRYFFAMQERKGKCFL